MRSAGGHRLASRLANRFRKRPRTPSDTDPGVPKLTAARSKADELAGTGMLTMARRLPDLTAQALRLAWEASPRDTTAAIGLNLVSGVFTAFGLLATTGVLQALFTGGPTPDRVRAALPALLLVGAAVGAKALLSILAGWAEGRLGPQVDRLVELRLYNLTTAIELAALDDSDFLDDMQRAQWRGMSSASEMVTDMVNMLTAAVGLVAAGGALGVLHPLLLPLLLLTALPDAWSSVRAARLRYSTMISLIENHRRKYILSDLMTQRGHAAEIRSFTVRDFLLDQYATLARRAREVELSVQRRQMVTRAAGGSLKGVATGLVYLALGVLLWRGTVPLAVAGTAVLGIRTGQTSLANLVFAINHAYEDGLYFADFLKFCRIATDRTPRADRPAEAPAAFETITADDVTFTYPGGESPSLKGVSVHLNRGEIVALVGENGSGKTTLAKILAGLYDPQEGEVRWDGTSLWTIAPERLRERIAVIAQDHTHWPMTARQNITMGRPAADGEVEAAAAASGADAVIAELTHGFETLLDRRFDGGAELSGGQWQRLAAARGFYRDAPLLICDEPTAALDARAEHALFERIRAHADGRTVVLITHRLASVRHADRIYVLAGGEVIEQGDHASLMAGDGLYAELYRLQAEAYDQNPERGHGHVPRQAPGQEGEVPDEGAGKEYDRAGVGEPGAGSGSAGGVTG